MIRCNKLLAMLCLPLLLAACGGSGDDGSARPIADAGPDQTVEMGSTVTLDGTGSSTPNTGPLAYRWSFVTKPASSTAELSSETAADPNFIADLPGTYEANLVVNDGVADSAHDRVVVTVTNPDPVAIAPVEHNVLIGTTITLDGIASLPPTGGDPTSLAYQWTLTEKPVGSNAVLAAAQSATASFYADVAGTYTATLVVSYQNKASEPLTVTVTASITNTRPVADAGGPYTVERGQMLTLDGTGSSDADGDALSYRWYLLSPGGASGFGSIYIPNGSSLRLESAIEGYDTAEPTITPDVVGNWIVSLEVYDGTTLSSTASATITVTKPEAAANTPPVASFFGMPRVGFYDPVWTNEVELGGIVWSSGSSWDIDGGFIGAANRRFKWISTPEGYTQSDLSASGSFSFTPTVEGQYTVEMVVIDAEDPAIETPPLRRTFVARTGANRAPTANITVDSSTILVGGSGWFDGRASVDPDGDQLTYNWFLFDRPDGSSATLRFENVTLESGAVLTNARASIVADKPGVYMVLLAVTDSHGVTSSPTSTFYGKVIAKAQNNAPSIGRVSNNNDQHAARRRNTHYNDSDQPYIVGDEPVELYAINVVDPDLDALYYLWTLDQPAGSELTDAGVTQTFTPGSPVVPGAYTATAIVSDGIATSESHSLRFNVVERDDYPSLLLEDYYSAPLNRWDRAVTEGFAGPGPGVYPRHRAFPYWHHGDGSFPVFVNSVEAGDNVVKNYRLTAFGGDYTIRNLQVGTSTNLEYPGYTGKFDGLSEGQVIRLGESVDFSLVVTAPGGQGTTTTMNNITEGIVYRFEIAEKPGWTFEYQPYMY